MKIKPFKKEKISNKKKITMIIVGSIAIVILFMVIYQSFSVYNLKLSETIIDAKVGPLSDIKTMAIFIDDVHQTGMNDFPTDKKFDRVRCYENGVWNQNITGVWESNSLTINNFTKNTDCNVYFISSILLRDKILEAHGGITTIAAKGRPNFNTVSTTTSGANGGMFAEPDGMMGGTSYYFRGTHGLNNNVIFAGYQWKIIRIDGAGNIRMIYNGTEAMFNELGTVNGNMAEYDALYSSSQFCSSTNSIDCFDYDKDPDDWFSVRAYVDEMYNDLSTTARSRIVTTAYCNDRSCDLTGCGTAQTVVTYNAFLRIGDRNPSFGCHPTYRINLGAGLITADEVAFAGAVVGGGSPVYLTIAYDYWSMTPATFMKNFSVPFNFGVNYRGSLEADFVGGSSIGVRPVLSLRPDTLFFSGTGSASNPYIVLD